MEFSIFRITEALLSFVYTVSRALRLTLTKLSVPPYPLDSIVRTATLCALLMPAARAAEEIMQNYDIPAGEAAVTFRMFSDVSGREILFGAEAVRGVRTNAVVGKFTSRQALDRMLAGTALHSTQDEKTGALAVIPVAPAEAHPPARGAKPSASTAPRPPETTTTTTTMKKSKNLRYPSLALLGLFGAGLSAQTPDATTTSPPDNSAVVLPTFQVNDTTDKGYLAGNSVSATRINTPIADLPFAISAFTPQFMQDIAARDLFDVVKYAAGVMSGSSEFLGGDTDYMIRGFNQYPEHDGFYESGHGNVYVDTSDVERVEVVKGPSALLYGAIAPGGTVNYITKQATTTPFVTVYAEAGSYSLGRVTLDVNQPIVGNTVLFRFNAALENGYQYAQGTNARTTVLDPTVTWNITPRLSLRVNYQYFHRSEDPPEYMLPQLDVGSPSSVVASLNNPGNPGPSALLTGTDGSDQGQLAFYQRYPINANYTNNTDYRVTTLQSLDVELDGTLNAHWKSRANFNLNNAYDTVAITGQSEFYIPPPNSLVFTGGAWAVAPSWAAMTSAQQFAAGLAFAKQADAENTYFPLSGLQLQNGTQTPVVIPERQRYQWDKDNSDTLQWEAAGDYAFSWGSLKPLAGLFYDTNGAYSYTISNLGTPASPYFRNWDVDPASPTYYINHATTFPNPTTLGHINSDTLAWTSDQDAYAVLNGSFLNDRLFVIGGARYNRSQSETTNYISSNPYGAGYKAHYTTPQLGLGYKITKDFMWYASFSKSYQLPSATFLSQVELVNGVYTSVPTTQAPPTIGTGYETGFKTNFMNGRISSTVSVYEIKQTDVVQTVDENIGGATLGLSVDSVAVTSRGVELETTISPTDNWQIFVSASEDDARNSAEPAGDAYFLGEEPQYFSKTLFNLWTRYNLAGLGIRGLWVGGGGNYTGRMMMNTVNSQDFLPSYMLWHAAAGYDWNWGKLKMNAKVNVDNISNIFYVPATQERGLPRTVIGSVSVTF